MKEVKEYIIGLDIGTNSCGYVVTDKQNNILKLKGKTAIGARLFKEGQAAADRRSFRTTRRRLARRRWRLSLLEEIFDPEMAKVDSSFFRRLKESDYSPKDSRKQFNAIVFENATADKEFYDKYPTIYHLRNALMHDDQKHDLREIFMAVHHIVKYRGNFLREDSVKAFKATKFSLRGEDGIGPVDKLNDLLKEIYSEHAPELEISNLTKIEEIVKDKQLYKQDKLKQIANLLTKAVDSKDKAKLNKDIAKQVANALMGYMIRFDTIFNLSDVDSKDYKVKFSDANIDEKLDTLTSLLTDKQTEFVLELQSIYNTIVLNEIVPDGMSLSESMVKKYDDHKKDLKLYKEYIDSLSDKKKAKQLEAAYALYVNYRKADLLAAKNLLGKKADNMNNFEVFGKFVSDNLDDSELANKIKARLDLGEFLPKQRTNQNGVIPYQLHQVELTQILEKQGKYYPFLITPNPVESHRNNAPYEISELVSFRVPYYVGPLIDNQSIKDKQNKNKFAWMVRQKQGQITPWNFEEMVDTTESANQFIKRMTRKDTYLLAEDVLPKSSLIYQKFMILDELNRIKIDGKKLTSEQKHDIFEKLFKKQKSINLDNLKNYLLVEGNIPGLIEGLSDGINFNNSFSTYIDYRNIFGDEIDNPNKQADFEKMIEWSTVFEDRKIFKRKLKEITWLTPEQINQVSSKRYSGWGRLSKKLLTQITDENGVNILQRLWNEPETLTEVLANPVIKRKISEANSLFVQINKVENILDDAYTSPQNKKAIRQVIRVVDDIIVAAHGKKPSQIAIEFTRSSKNESKVPDTRKKQLDKIYNKISSEILDSSIKNELKNLKSNKYLSKDKLFLYFKQMGRDAYTGDKLSLDQLQNYDIDHIFPRSFIKDDSLDNRVLTQKPINAKKSDYGIPALEFGNKYVPDLGITVKEMWKLWQENGLISKSKLINLCTNPKKIGLKRASGFINRQLVETSQVIKLVAIILQAELPDTEIIEVKALQNTILRESFHLYKNRSVNDYHHAIDAYLTTIVGNYLYQVYPKLRPYFVYGQFKKFNQDKNIDILKRLKNFNFLRQLIFNTDDNIYISGTKEIVFNKKDIVHKLETAYGYKYMNISRECCQKTSSLFDQTLYAHNSNVKNSLIPKKKGLPTEIYGGYSGNKDSFFVLVKIVKKRTNLYRIVGIPTRELDKLNSSNNYNQALNKIVESKLCLKETESFKILIKRLLYGTLIVDNGQKFRIGSFKEKHNVQQLVLQLKSMEYIKFYIDGGKNYFTDAERKELEKQDRDKCLLYIFDDIMNVVNKHFTLFDMSKYEKDGDSLREKFNCLDFNDKVSILSDLLKAFHANSDRTSITKLKITNLGRHQAGKNGITLTTNAQIIYQSPTGLFERRVKIKDL
ncbi:type II CRISPR RNA-guided endonuclease Cas9 [Lactobacillus mulieris]|uniref:CRISPR-associated endonuclease Cas9 n=1 Tax=Lactobacillus mulieris TaxID=2508708 RepID=A0ABT4K3I7_9LACO|nr:type II CRISPR RNA-guided endonuclease Cas9 [Lactobacillus mulieris]MCZ3622702.1 type II CRISPR RNA-guided endonuclease Cas9 [Lactobacillus mulieris]MCZ3624323.1 type II CRISPR RNA-guided endonuclease Cas9 [Lactobacillus mulieris]MCZ3636692.1 type II CRISPR RNA-guided endonuclease Cas9 [Lactobacillus mulieris]MCZ3690442.1 type II CRISPR RNA-guided endonuclease Cas9 [Lactobacillus mulieris]MCZ3696411.1 type II CRISPR RNA-guided endonuclease Cas9 [Lactobacillus mulieris]